MTNDGGKAFPNVVGCNGYGPCVPHVDASGSTHWVEHDGGMSLRDYFAAKAMQSLILTNPGCLGPVCKQAYEFADVMLNARETNVPIP